MAWPWWYILLLGEGRTPRQKLGGFPLAPLPGMAVCLQLFFLLLPPGQLKLLCIELPTACLPEPLTPHVEYLFSQKTSLQSGVWAFLQLCSLSLIPLVLLSSSSHASLPLFCHFNELKFCSWAVEGGKLFLPVVPRAAASVSKLLSLPGGTCTLWA